MPALEEARDRLTRIPHLQVTRNEPLSVHTRFGLRGAADLIAVTEDRTAFVEGLREARESGLPWTVIGGGTNLVVCDEGFRGIVLRFDGRVMRVDGASVFVEAGASLQDVVDLTILRGLRGLETMTGIPGHTGAAVYGNAGAYGRSIQEIVERVEFFDGREVREFDNAACEFRYRESLFKRHKEWQILSVALRMEPADAAALKKTADEILEIRNKKYPPEMRCAGSFFKNCLWAELPEEAREEVPANLVRDGKVPSAWFLEQVGAKGMRQGCIRMADYHANTPFNAGGGTARQVVELIMELKRRVRERFAFELEEEVQYVGFPERLPGLDHLEQTVGMLDALLTGLDGDQLRWSPGAGRWSIAQVLAHLVEAEENCFGPRLRRFAEEVEPAIENFEPTTIDRDAREGMADLRQQRAENLAYLHTLPPQAAVRVARHSSIGLYTFAHQLNEWAFHDLGHVRQIAELVRTVKYYPYMGPYQLEYKVNP